MPEQAAEPARGPEKPGSSSPDASPDAGTEPKADARKAAKSHFDDRSDGEGEESRRSGDRQPATHEFLTMFGTLTSSVMVIGDGVRIGTVVGGDPYHATEKSGPVLNRGAGRTVSEIAELCIEPTGFDTLAEPIARHRLVLLGTVSNG